MIHTVKRPFMCRRDQFKSVGFPGSILAIGISVQALNSHNPYRFKIGENPTVYYGDSKSALAIAYMWTNRTGKTVAIIPVSFFQREESKRDQEIREIIKQKHEEAQLVLF